MTLSTTINKVSYSGTGSQDVFAYTFKVYANTDLKVYIRDTLGTETLKTITTHYTVSNVGDANGGNVTFTSGNIPLSTDTVVILREIPLTQTFDYVLNDPFPSSSHEDGLDKLTMQVQQLNEEVDRSIKASKTNTITSTEFAQSAVDRANKIFSFDSSGELNISTNIGSNRGNWAAATAYYERDVIKDTSNNNVYQVNDAHTSSGSQPISSNANVAKYTLLVDAAAATVSATAAATSATASAGSATASAASAVTSGNSATASASSATNSASSASTAAGHVSTAAGHVSTASGHVTDASQHKQTAERWANLTGSTVTDVDTGVDSGKYSAKHYADLAETTLDNFDDIYLGAKSSAPTLDNDGDALATGALYFNTSSDDLFVWNGSAWEQASFSAGGFLSAASNLSDVANAGTSRTNLGVAAGTSANNYVQLDGSARLPAVNASQLTNLPASGGSVDKTAKYAVTAGQPVGLYSDGKVGLAKNWVDIANISHTTGQGTEIIETYNNNENNPYICYSVEHDKYIVTSRGSSSSSQARYRVGTKSGTTITWGTEAVLVSEDMGKCRLFRVRDFNGDELFACVGSGGGSNNYACRFGTFTFDGTTFTARQGMFTIDASKLSNWNGSVPSLATCQGGGVDGYATVKANSTHSGMPNSGTFVFGMGSKAGQYYEAMYQAYFLAYPDGSSGSPYNWSTATTSYNTNQFQYVGASMAQSVTAHPDNPYFYMSRKPTWTNSHVSVWKLYFSSLQYTGVTMAGSISGGRMSCDDSTNTNIDTSAWGGRDDTPTKLIIQEDGVGRCFVLRDRKIYAPKFDPKGSQADGRNSDDVNEGGGSTAGIDGTFNQIVAVSANTSENTNLDISVEYDYANEIYFLMHIYYDSTQGTNTDKGRIYYGVLDKDVGISTPTTSELPNYKDGMYVATGNYSQIESVMGKSGAEVGWTMQERYAGSGSGGYAGIWGADAYAIAPTYIGIAQSSVSADATVTVKLQGTEDNNQSGLTIGEKVQFQHSDGAITSTDVAVVTSTHTELGIATSATEFIIKE